MNLAEYKLLKGLSLTALAAEIGVSVPAVHDWINGKKRPSWASMLLIHAATGGSVTANDFMPARASTQGNDA
jgi:transcriptional regulator with XRE-family HTH domain